MATVQIPEAHFLRSIKRQYAHPDAAIVREVLQNSIDAGATQIYLTVSPEGWFEVDDNGRGMSEERMVNALLTFGGSDKDANAIGGFGIAKELILFAHARYEIHSRDIHVKGQVLHYELSHGEFRQGTRIRLYFHEEYGFDFNAFMRSARDIFASSEFSIAVTLNGETIEGTAKGRTVRVFPWGKVHCRKREHGPIYYATVRSKGLMMFQHYVGSIDRDVIVEVTGDAKDIFTATRDRFAARYSDELQALFNELTVEKKSFGRKVNERLLFSGSKGAFDDLVLQQLNIPTAEAPELSGAVGEVMSLVRAALDAETVAETAKRALADQEATDELEGSLVAALASGVIGQSGSTPVQRPSTGDSLQAATKYVLAAAQDLATDDSTRDFIREHAAEIANYVCRHSYDFIVHMENTKYRKIPKRYEPSNLSRKDRYVAQLWKHSVKQVLEANNIRTKFRIGWVLNDEVGALYLDGQDSDGGDGVPAFLLNPESAAITSLPKGRKALFTYLLSVAVHEVTHTFCTYHNEDFSTKLNEILANTLLHANPWNFHAKAAKAEVI